MATLDNLKEKQEKLLKIISTEILETDADFHEHTDLYGVGLDSMATMQLVIRIEQNFSIKLPVNKITKENFSTVSALAKLL